MIVPPRPRRPCQPTSTGPTTLPTASEGRYKRDSASESFDHLMKHAGDGSRRENLHKPVCGDSAGLESHPCPEWRYSLGHHGRLDRLGHSSLRGCSALLCLDPQCLSDETVCKNCHFPSVLKPRSASVVTLLSIMPSRSRTHTGMLGRGAAQGPMAGPGNNGWSHRRMAGGEAGLICPYSDTIY